MRLLALIRNLSHFPSHCVHFLGSGTFYIHHPIDRLSCPIRLPNVRVGTSASAVGTEFFSPIGLKNVFGILIDCRQMRIFETTFVQRN